MSPMLPMPFALWELEFVIPLLAMHELFLCTNHVRGGIRDELVTRSFCSRAPLLIYVSRPTHAPLLGHRMSSPALYLAGLFNT